MIRAGTGPDGRSYWDIIVQPGRVWSDPADGGWSRASFPFSLMHSIEGETHNGVATFLYKGAEVSTLHFQIVQQTSPYYVVDFFTASGNVPGRLIVQWYHFTRWNHQDTALDFEAKLLDDGTVEYHYQTATGSYGDAHDATIWLQRLDGSAALGVSVNTAGNWDQTALRFTLKP